MTHPIIGGSRLKIMRANEQFKALGAAVAAYLAREPYASFIELDEQRKQVSFGVEVREQVDLCWSVIVGEILHNFRSALDHSLWQLVIHDGGSPHNRTAFPIYVNPTGFDQEWTKRRGRRGMLEGLRDNSFKLIRELQPFAKGEHERSPLWQLHELSNFDKHRALHFTGAIIKCAKLSLGPLKAGAIPQQQILVDHGPFEGHTVIIKFTVPSWFQDTPNVEVVSPVAFDLAFARDAPVPGAPLLDTLDRIGHRVHEAVEQIGDVGERG